MESMVCAGTSLQNARNFPTKRAELGLGCRHREPRIAWSVVEGDRHGGGDKAMDSIMAADDDRARARSPYEIPADEPPVTKAGDGDWVLEFARPKGGEIEIAVKRVGGIVRIRGMAVVRHAKGMIDAAGYRGDARRGRGGAVHGPHSRKARKAGAGRLRLPFRVSDSPGFGAVRH